MADIEADFIGQIKTWAGIYAPRLWAFCNGGPVKVDQNRKLFDVIGYTYGGSNDVFHLPDLRDRIPIGTGRGPGLTERKLGVKGGVQHVTIEANQMPAHTHQLRSSDELGESPAPNDKYVAKVNLFNTPAADRAVPMSAGLASVGKSEPHTNLQPGLAITFIIALDGPLP